MALTGGEYLAVWDGARWVSIRGDKGDAGSLVIKGSVAAPTDLPATGNPGDVYLVSGNLYSWDDATSKWIDGGKILGPQGPQGLPGTPGRDGIDGVSPSVRVGSVTEGPLGITNTGTSSQAVLNFTIPKGDAGPTGADGAVPTISIGTTSQLPSGDSATVTKSGTATNVILSFGIPRGDTGAAGPAGLKGDPGSAGAAGSVGPAGATGPAGTPGKDGAAGTAGKDGAAASIAIGTVATLDAGKPVTVSNSGTSSAAVINFGIPQGTQGLQGPAGADGASATIAIGTVISGTKAAVTNTGTASAAIINFTVPSGATGAAGADGKDGAGVTIKGTLTGAATPLPTAVAGDMYLLGDPVPTAAPSPSVGAKVAGDGIVYNGTAWTNVGPIRGPAGPAGAAGAKGADGPTAVSADAHNYSKLGSDNKLFTPTPAIPAAATALPLVDGKAASVGVSLKYAREDHAHILPTLTALGAADATHTHAASTDITGLSTVATSGKYADLIDGYTLPTATDKILGAIKVGTGLTMTGDVLSASGTTSPDASTTTKGIVQLADAAAITAGTASRAVDAAQLKAGLDLKAPINNPSFTGKVTIPTGNGANPGLHFLGDSDTGIYLPTANAMGFLAGGAQALTVATTGVTVTGNLISTGDITSTGNITSSGKSHKFEDGSIARAAIAGIDQTTLDDRYVNVTGDTMTGPLLVGGGRSLFTAKNEPFSIGARNAATGGYVYFGATDATATPGIQLSSAGGGRLLSVSKDGLVNSEGAIFATGPLAVGTSAPAGEAASAKMVVVGLNQNATNLAESNTKAAISFRPKVASGYTLAIGAMSPTNNPYLQGVNFNGGAASCTFSIQPYGGSVAIGKTTAPLATLDIAGDVAVSKGAVISNGGSTFGLLVNSDTAGTASAAQSWGISVYNNVASVDSRCFAAESTGLGTSYNVLFSAGALPDKPINYAFYSGAEAQNYFKGRVGINWTTPTSQLEVNGTTKLRGALEVTGNITSAGTAHAFAAKSIPSSAVDGMSSASTVAGAALATVGAVGVSTSFARADHTHPFPTAANVAALPIVGGTLTGALTAPSVTINGNITSTGTAHSFAALSIPVTALSAFPTVPTATPASQTAPGVAGQMQWDASYLYVAIAANQWRRIPFADWFGNSLPGTGAGATDTALPATFVSAGSTAEDVIGPHLINGTFYDANMTASPLKPLLGKIAMQLGYQIPPLSTGIKVQYRIHGGTWVDATVSGYFGCLSTSVAHATFALMKAAGGSTRRVIVISGPPPGTPYITRMAWVSSLGTGLWSTEYTAVTPTA